MIPDDALRAEAEALVKRLSPRRYPFARKERKQDVDLLVVFAKAQRAAEVLILKVMLEDSMRPVSPWAMRETIIDWLDQRAKEWET